MNDYLRIQFNFIELKRQFCFYTLDCTPSNCCSSVTGSSWWTSWDEWWSELLPRQQKHWKTLGWDQGSWDDDDYNPTIQVGCYRDLNAVEIYAVKSLCYNQKQWDEMMFNAYGVNCGKNTSKNRLQPG